MESTSTGMSNKKSFSNPLLKRLISHGNPFPPKSSYAKGKKKLQKRRRTSFNIPGGSIGNSNTTATTGKQSLIGGDDDDGVYRDEIFELLRDPLIVKVKKEENVGGVENHVKIVQELKQGEYSNNCFVFLFYYFVLL